MGQAMPRQHPAVVPRSQYVLVRALLATAMIAVAGLTVAVVILAGDSDDASSTSTAKPIESIRYGDFNPATGRPESAGNARHDGSLEERTIGRRARPVAQGLGDRRRQPRDSKGSKFGTSQDRFAQP
jgi:hypothetical protein